MIFTGWMLSLSPDQECQCTEGNIKTLEPGAIAACHIQYSHYQA